MFVYSTEITSHKILSDNPIHQRLLKPYIITSEMISGDVLELGCGEGRGIEYFQNRVSSYTGLDKTESLITHLQAKYPKHTFKKCIFPSLDILPNDTFDWVISFQVIEHIKDDCRFLEEIKRVLKPNGKAIITTPNAKMSSTRNPWHIREYSPTTFKKTANSLFKTITIKGIYGNEKVLEYYQKNKISVEKITKWDLFRFQYILPSVFLRIPYNILNRINRNKLKKQADDLVLSISDKDYFLIDDAENVFDLFIILSK